MNNRFSRRTFFGAAGLCALSQSMRQSYAAAVGSDGCNEKCFMDQYYDGIMTIAHGIRDTQIDAIGRAMEKAYELKSAGGAVYSHVNYGHYSMYAGSKDVPGQPWVLPQCGITPTQAEFDAMKKGDFLITDRIDKGTKEVRERGVYIVGVTNNYYKFSRTKPGGLRPDRMETSIEEISDIVIDSYVPWDNGLVSAPAIPQFKLCPSTGIAQFLVYWACTASLANLIGSKGKGSSSKPAEQYLDLAIERFGMVGTDRTKIDSVAKKWADLVLGKKARLLVYGHNQDVETYGATQTRNMFVNDAVICASSSMIAQPYTVQADNLRKEDIVLIGAFTSDNQDELRVARTSRKTGAYTVAFCPFGTDGDTSGDRLFKEVDVAFNCYSDESAGVIAVPGFDKKVSPIAPLTGNLIHWMLTAQWTDHMARRGEMPYYWQGYHETGGQQYDNSVEPFFKKRGY